MTCITRRYWPPSSRLRPGKRPVKFLYWSRFGSGQPFFVPSFHYTEQVMGDPALLVFGIIPDPLDYFVGSGICPTGYHRGGRWSMVHQDLAAALYAGPQARPSQARTAR